MAEDLCAIDEVSSDTATPGSSDGYGIRTKGMLSSITTSRNAQMFSGVLTGQNIEPNEIYAVIGKRFMVNSGSLDAVTARDTVRSGLT